MTRKSASNRQGYVAEACKHPMREIHAIRGPEDAVKAFHGLVSKNEMREHFVGLYLTSRSEIIAPYIISIGSLNAAIVHPREVLRPAIEESAASIIILHNHPSGDCTPSDEDMAITKRIAEACKIMGIELLDHIVVGEAGTYASFSERRLLRR